MKKNNIILGSIIIIIAVLLVAVNIPTTRDAFVDDYGTDYGAVGVWNFEEGTGTTTFDQSPYGNDGTITGATWAVGKYGEALTFDGNDYVTVPDSVSLNISDNITIEAWAKDASSATHKVIVEKSDAYSLYINNTNILYGQINSTRVSYTVPIVTDWHYYSMTYDNVILKLYIDGVLVNSTALMGSISLNANDVTMGTRFLGEIDQVRIYKVAKTLGEIRNHYLNSGHMYSGSVIVSDDFRILNTTFGEELRLDDDGLNLHHNYVLYSDFSHWDSFVVEGGKTDELLNIMPAGLATQDRHFHRITLAVNVAPGGGKEFNITLTDGIGSMFVSLTGAETSGYDDTNEFDWDVSADTLTLMYTQDAGGSVTNAFITIKYHYKETP